MGLKSNVNKRMPCLMSGCNNQRYKNKSVCEKHWKERRNNLNYKRGRED